MRGNSDLLKPRFVSWRWRLMLPLFTLLLLGAMSGTYLFADLPQVAETNSYIADARLQLIRLLMTAVSAGVVIVVFVGVSLFLGRVNRVRSVVEALAAGDSTARTRMSPTDEIGALGSALDRYADHVQERQDALRASLRRQRREIEHLTSVLESMPDGVIVQDSGGNVIMINERAREWFGAKGALKGDELKNLTAAITDALGPALAPSLYAIGEPQRIEVGGRILNAQAAAVLSMANQRVGTVIVLRDMTNEANLERAREQILNKIASEVQSPLTELANRAGGDRRPISLFAREMTRHAVALQKLIVEMRDLTSQLDTNTLSRRQRTISLDTMVWALANEWKQVAQAANLTLQVLVEQSGMYTEGDERRIRWAVGNVIDNAIKYTPPGGTLSLELSSEVSGRAYLRVKDSGVGITPDELSRVFDRFFRGNPVTPGGRVIRVPGTGQGLTIAKMILEAHGGSIRIKSSVREGTSVYISLPIVPPSDSEKPVPTFAELEGETVRLTTPLEIRRQA